MNYVVAVILAWVGIFFLGRELLHKWGEKEGDKADRIKYLRCALFDMGLDEEFKRYWEQHSGFSEYQALKYFFTPELLSKYESRKQEDAVRENEHRKKRHAEICKHRAFAYRWEKFIYALYSPFAQWNNVSKTWELPYRDSSLPISFVRYKIMNWLSCTEEEAKEIISDLTENEVLVPSSTAINSFSVGCTLTTYAHCLDEQDMDLTQWMNTVGRHTSLEQLRDEIKNFGSK